MDAHQHVRGAAHLAHDQRHVLGAALIAIDVRGEERRAAWAGALRRRARPAARCAVDRPPDRRCSRAAAGGARRTPRSDGRRAMLPSSSTTSHRTPQGASPAARARSTAASVCPRRSRTPPGRARSGKMCPGRAKSSACALGSASAAQRGGAIGGRDAGAGADPIVDRDRERRPLRLGVVGHHQRQLQGAPSASAESAAQTTPLVWRTMKATAAGRHLLGRHDQIAFVFAVGVVDDDGHAAARRWRRSASSIGEKLMVGLLRNRSWAVGSCSLERPLAELAKLVVDGVVQRVGAQVAPEAIEARAWRPWRARRSPRTCAMPRPGRRAWSRPWRPRWPARRRRARRR